jgi:hypothetical protein
MRMPLMPTVSSCAADGWRGAPSFDRYERVSESRRTVSEIPHFPRRRLASEVPADIPEDMSPTSGRREERNGGRAAVFYRCS